MPPPSRAPLAQPSDVARRFAAGEVVLLDVREPFELEAAAVAGALHIPMGQVVRRVLEIPRDKPVACLCHHGARSQQVADWLLAQGYRAENVAGGIDAWADRVDGTIPRY